MRQQSGDHSDVASPPSNKPHQWHHESGRLCVANVSSEAVVAHGFRIFGDELAVEPRRSIGADLLLQRERRKGPYNHRRGLHLMRLERRRSFQMIFPNQGSSD
jgi:hypothetical protein